MEYIKNKFDTIVVGAGHAGCEAALAASKLGSSVLLCSMNLDNIAMMPCNPAIGGPAKSTLVREIDALGGGMAEVADASYIQMKMLNSSKGPAVQALRAQSDKKEYMQYMKGLILKESNIYLKQVCITELLTEDGQIIGARDEYGNTYHSKTVILTTGTSLDGKIYIGLRSYPAGRLGEMPAIGLSQCLKDLGFDVKKLKTGTPARVDARTIDYAKMIIQPGDEQLNFYSYRPNRPVREQIPCYLTRTNAETHRIINENIHQSPMYQGLIEGVGPRYCPSIEDKVKRFSSNPSHHIFIEPEGKDTYEVYVQGFSTSLPADVQVAMLRTLPGLENVHVIKPAYAVEYDYVPAIQLSHSLMSQRVRGLFHAGQINGTSGYEEAAAQGLVAGINAAKYTKNEPMLELSRASSYIGTLIDDLVTKDIQEPYRMLTSRSEYRLLLRGDNADFRLTKIGYELGLVEEQQYQRFVQKQMVIEAELKRLATTKLSVSDEANVILSKCGENIERGIKLGDLLKRPNIKYTMIKELDEITRELDLPREIYEQIEILIKYDGYLSRQTQQIEQAQKLEKYRLPEDIDYSKIVHISTETKEKLIKIRPKTLAQASRIGGVKPADISVLMVLLNR